MIPIVWVERSKDNDHRSRYGVCTQLNEMFDYYNCEHFAERPEGADGAVFVIQGGNLRDRVEEINALAAPLRYAIFILMGDEECVFPSWELRHPNMRLWLQTPRIELTADRYYPCGYPNDARRLIEAYRRPERDLAFFFAGQFTHIRRLECVRALEGLPNGIVIPTAGFGMGMAHEEYFKTMTRAKVVPCPSGPETPDTYRVYEALEAGAVPVVDAISPKGGEGYWEKVFGPDHPLIVIKNWNEFPEILNAILMNWDQAQLEVYAWWITWKMNFLTWLGKDLDALK
jgi:hypothetical protein